VKLAATTGYNEEMTRIVLDAAAAQGFTPDAWRCAAQVKQGRPAPWMIFQLLEELDVYPPAAVVKVGDTVADMEAARNAGVWAIGVVKTGNMLGLSEAEAKALGPDELEHLLAAGRARLSAAGAHHVVDSFADAAALLAP
jgi:phosphonoacetaldehyde hydrolase